MITRFFSALVISLGLLLSSLAFAQDTEFLHPEEAFQLSAEITDGAQGQELSLIFSIVPEYYMYREQFKLSVVDAEIIDGVPEELSKALLGETVYPEGLVKFDPTFNKDLEVYYQQALLTTPLLKPVQAFTLEVTAQGCADAGLCYPPMYFYIPITPTSTGYEISLPKQADGLVKVAAAEEQLVLEEEANEGAGTSGLTASSSASTSSGVDLFNAGDTEIAGWLNQANIWSMLAIAFALGLALSFTPCVLPMLPILLSIIVGSKPQDGNKVSPYHGLRLTLMYVLGTSIVYTVLGIVAASIGAALANWIQNPWVLSIFALFLVAFGIAMFGSFTFQMPASVQTKLNNFMNKLPAGQMGGSLIMGMVSALICGPCVAAPLAGVLLFISQTGDVVSGGLILFVLAWGQGASLLLLGSSSGALLPKSGQWMNTVKYVCGLLLFAAALWMVMPLLPAWLPMILWALLAFAFAWVVGSFKGYRPIPSIWALIVKFIGLAAFAWGVLLLVGLSMGSRSVISPLTVHEYSSEATQFTRVSTLAELENVLSQTDKPVMLDFYADWCISCREMESFTFTEANVKAKMDQMLLLQVDVTKNNRDDRALLKRFKLFGPPGIIFFDKTGKELGHVRVIGFQNAERFAQNLDKVLAE
ncbi:MAG: protein-disulfide reductase DsbD [Pelistega sp.]|nr:protein-disulfide reductase DsbD [Pelistega sp.]